MFGTTRKERIVRDIKNMVVKETSRQWDEDLELEVLCQVYPDQARKVLREEMSSLKDIISKCPLDLK